MKVNCRQRRVYTEWHKIFAFLPHRVGPNDCRWLEFIERKYEWIKITTGERFYPQYRAISK